MNSLVAAHVKIGRLGINEPGARISQLGEAIVSKIGYLNDIRWLDELACLVNALTGPEARGQVHGLALWLEANEVFNNGGVDVGSASLIEHDGIVFGNLEESSDFLLGHLKDTSELGRTMTHLHHALASAFVVDHVTSASIEHGARQNARSSGEVPRGLAFITTLHDLELLEMTSRVEMVVGRSSSLGFHLKVRFCVKIINLRDSAP